MADEHIQVRMGVDHANVAKGLNTASASVRQFVGKTRKDFQEVGKTFQESFREANRTLSQAVGLGIASLARRAVEDVWDLMTKRAAEFLYSSYASSDERGTTLEQRRQSWRAARKEQVAAMKRDEEIAKDNAKREEIRVDMIRTRKRIEEETNLKAGDDLAFLKMKIKHLKEDIALARERMKMHRAANAEEASMMAIHNEKQMLAIALAEQQLKLEEAKLPKAPPPIPFVPAAGPEWYQDTKRQMRERMSGIYQQMMDRRDASLNKAKAEQTQAQLNESLSKLITPEGLKVTPGG